MNPEIGFLLNKSIESLKNSNLDSADLYLKQALKLHSTNPHVLRILGVVAAQRKQYAQAIEYLNASLKAFPKNSLALSNLGNIFHELKDYEKAIDYYEKSIKIDPNYYEAWSNKGNVLYELKRYKEAVVHHDNSIELNPNYAEAWCNKGNALAKLTRYEEAIAHHEKAIGLNPNYAQAWCNRGVVLNQVGRYEEALISCIKANDLNLLDADAWSNRGFALNELKLYEDSLGACSRAIEINPHHADAWSNLGVALNELNRYEDSLEACSRAIEINPHHADAWSNLGVALNELKRYEEAVTSYDKAIDCRPNFYEALYNRGVALNELKRYEEALASYNSAIESRPNGYEAYWNKGLSLLLQGDFKNGLPLYEHRWSVNEGGYAAAKRSFDQPTWLGLESLKGKTIFIYAEQGFGDFIQFCRYTKLICDLGARVILETPKALVNLLANLEGVSHLITQGEQPPPFDYQCPLLSLPLAFQTDLESIPPVDSTIQANFAKNSTKIAEWKERLGLRITPRVGLAWSGNPKQRNDRNRSLTLEQLIKVLPTGFEYVSLQKEIREVDRLTLQCNPSILNFASSIHDFEDTAALIDQMDLVISVDTSVAHLSGTMGKETWILLPHAPDWRWLLDRDDCPWYPSVKLYRQNTIGDWGGVLAKVKADLQGLT